MTRVRMRRRLEIKSEINIVPLLDVLLVLILIFMSTTPVVTQNVEVNLPSSSVSKNLSSKDNIPVIIEVSGIAEYALVVGHKRIEKLIAEQIIAEVIRYLEHKSKTIFLIGGAKDVPYKEIIKVLQLLHQAGVHSVGLMTQPI